MAKSKKSNARKIRSEKTASKIRRLAMDGRPQSKIAELLGSSVRVVTREYAKEIAEARLVRKAIVTRNLLNAAVTGSMPAAIFWLKARSQWRTGKRKWLRD